MSNPSSPLLKIQQLNVRYGVIKAVRQVSLEIFPGELVCLIGANGAGKTTLLKSLMGLIKPESGSILFQQKEIVSHPPHLLAKQGLTLVPEGRGIFPP